MANKVHVYCFDYKTAIKLFTYNNDNSLPHVNHGAATKPEIIK